MSLFLLFTLLASSFIFFCRILKTLYHHFTNKRTLIIMRGLPGSGKTSLINHYISKNKLKQKNYSICSADDFFLEDDGKYKFNPRELPKAHSACLTDFIFSLQTNIQYIFLNNPNAQSWEYENYVYLAENKGYVVKVVEIECPGHNYIEYFNNRCKYPVPLSTCNLLHDRWEEDENAHTVIPYESDHEGDSLPCPKVTKEKLDDELNEIQAKNKFKLQAKKWTIVDNKGKKYI